MSNYKKQVYFGSYNGEVFAKVTRKNSNIDGICNLFSYGFFRSPEKALILANRWANEMLALAEKYEKL